VFTHFLAQLLESDRGDVSSLLLAVDSASLQAAAVCFLVSVSFVAKDSAKRTFMLFMLGVPSVAYVACTCFDIHARWPYVLSLVACFGGAACFFLRLNRKTSYLVAATSLCSLCGSMGESRRSPRFVR
jgi:hypothetical protein